MRQLYRDVPMTVLSLSLVCCSRPQTGSAPPVSATPEPAAQATAAPAAGAPRPTIEVNAFYDDLEPYGDWLEMPDYGWSFAPRVDDDWRPYTRGQWEHTGDGWYWDSDEEFGWATYHYGRWVDDRRYGWMWVPGDEWAPAWVSWRQGNGYTGWAPLPPRAGWRSNVGLQMGGAELDAALGARDYTFVEDRHFVDRGVYQHVQPSAINVTIITRTRNVTNYTTANNRVFNRGVPVGEMERSLGHEVSHLRTVDLDRRDDRGRGRVGTGEIAVFRPRVKLSRDRKPGRGVSVAKGEAPPSALVERGKRREQSRPGTGRVKDEPARDSSREADARERERVERERAATAAQQQQEQHPRGQQPQTDVDRGKRQGNPPPKAEKPKQDKGKPDKDKQDKAKPDKGKKGPKPPHEPPQV